MNIGIIGLGLIGGSIARATIKKTEHTVFAYDVNPASMQKGELLSCYHGVLEKPIYGKLDLLISCLYPDAFLPSVEGVLPHLKDGATVIDVAGNKRAITSAMSELSARYPQLNFISTHPMAGREFSGVEHSTATLFEGCSWLICPVRADVSAMAELKKYIHTLGARKVVFTTAEEHDRIISYTSQLCHVVSSAYVKSPTAERGLGYTAGSFRDLTRVARLNADMWTELVMQNSDNLLPEIDCLINSLEEYRQAIAEGDRQKLNGLFKDGTERKLAVEKSYARFIRNDDQD